MPRVFWRIFFAFWLVIVLSITATVVLNIRLDQARQQDGQTSERVERIARGVRLRALRELNRGGPRALARWGRVQTRTGGRVQILILDAQARELNDRRIPPSLNPLTAAWRSDRPLPETPRGARKLADVSHPVHGRFLILAQTPPRPLLLRMFGPLGPVGLLAVALMASILISWLLARTLTRPITRIRKTGRALGRGELDARVEPKITKRKDELGELANDFNAMASRLQALLQRQQELLRDVSHELRSPLARMRVALTLVEDAKTDAERAEYLERMETEIQRLDGLIENVLRYARLTQEEFPDRTTEDLAAMLESLVDSARLEARAKSIDVSYSGPDHLPFSAYPELLERALENVLRNAIAYSPAGSRIEVQVTDSDDQVQIRILDQGPGIPDDKLEAVFEPFMRISAERSEQGRSGGIGLAIVRAAVARHRGSVRASNRPDGGLEVRIKLPTTVTKA